MSLFITFEGTEGSGKTTQISLLMESFHSTGRSVVVTREPGGTPLGESLRSLLLDSTVPIGGEAEAYLMTAARAEHVATVIRPALERGDVVICDRFLDSTIAYQGGGRGLPVAELHAMQRLAVGPTMPTLTFLLDLPIDVGLERRARAMDGNRIDKETRAFHLRVAEWYRSEARAHPERWVIVDATHAPDVVHTAVTGAIRTRLGADIGVRAERGLGLR